MGHRQASEKLRAHLDSVRALGSANGLAVRRANTAKRVLSDNKLKKEINAIYKSHAAAAARAAIIPALGKHYVYKVTHEKPESGRGKGIKTNTLVEDPHEIAHALDVIGNDGGTDETGGVYYYITVKEPDFRAIEALMGRAIGKVADKVEGTIKHTFSLASLAKQRKALPAHQPVPIEARDIKIIDPT